MEKEEGESNFQVPFKEPKDLHTKKTKPRLQNITSCIMAHLFAFILCAFMTYLTQPGTCKFLFVIFL